MHVHSHAHRHHHHRGNLSQRKGRTSWGWGCQEVPILLNSEQLHGEQRLVTSSFYTLVLFCCRCSFPRMAAQAGRTTTLVAAGHQHHDTELQLPKPWCPTLHPHTCTLDIERPDAPFTASVATLTEATSLPSISQLNECKRMELSGPESTYEEFVVSEKLCSSALWLFFFFCKMPSVSNASLGNRC